MGKKVPEATVLKLAEINKKIDELYKLREKVVKQVFDKYGEIEEIVEVEGDKPYLRVKVIDHLEHIKSGQMIFKSAGLSRFELSISCLKNNPVKS